MAQPNTTIENIQNTLSNTIENAKDTVSSMYNNATETASNTYNTTSTASSSITQQLNSLKDSIADTVNEFSTKTVGDASAEFLQSNSLIARFAFIFIVIIIFMILLRLGIFLIGYILKIKNNPYIIRGLIPGSQPVTIKQDPNDPSSVSILRSNNQKTGIEFTWCVWLNIANIVIPDNKMTSVGYQHIFNKGNNEYDAYGIATVNNGPGLYLSSSTDPTLIVVMNMVSDKNPTQVIDVNNIPLKKWFHVLIRIQNNLLDVYVNGVVTKRATLPDVPKQNYQDIYVCQNNGYTNGFSGYLSDLKYYDYAMNIFDISNMVSAGPNLSTSSAHSSIANYGSTYLSSLWYTNKIE